MSPLARFALAVCLVSLAVAAVLALAGCGGGDPAEIPQSTYLPVSCNQPGACT